MKTVLITGASGGIGEAIAELAAKQHWMPILGYRSSREKVMALADRLRRNGEPSLLLELDLLLVNSLPGVLETLAREIEGLDALVLCASAPLELLPFTKLTSDIFLQQLTINAVASQVLISNAWKLFFRHRQNGHVLGVLSEAAASPPAPYATAYIAAKRALASVLESAASELGKNGLRVSAVSPNYTETPMLTKFHPHIVETMRTKSPGGRFLTANEVAERVVDQLNHPPPPGQYLVESVRIEEIHR
jgi:NAD(P)-dependent dehydrogenase (short-subunit alcohol dehydrogenase family)